MKGYKTYVLVRGQVPVLFFSEHRPGSKKHLNDYMEELEHVANELPYGITPVDEAYGDGEFYQEAEEIE